MLGFVLVSCLFVMFVKVIVLRLVLLVCHGWFETTQSLCRFGATMAHIGVVLWFSFVFFRAGCKWPIAHMPKLAMMQTISWFVLLGNR